MGAPQASPNVHGPSSPSSFSLHAIPNCTCPPSPYTFSNHTDGNFDSFEGTPSYEYEDPILQGQTAQEVVPVIEFANPNQETQQVPSPQMKTTDTNV
ncbi:hypothetical protein LOK49_LG06G00271 [Camellia lanceoleosa]|uniref:Uncharacterized protein n=1 Tax=Camellia lanceoleosa TaxID=1840588 RepID=A0ACC0HHN1_9ERIC|nr:hypothetical protein LOK49_LG06G00271 [Camellia lanceoleosa]